MHQEPAANGAGTEPYDGNTVSLCLSRRLCGSTPSFIVRTNDGASPISIPPTSVLAYRAFPLAKFSFLIIHSRHNRWISLANSNTYDSMFRRSADETQPPFYCKYNLHSIHK